MLFAKHVGYSIFCINQILKIRFKNYSPDLVDKSGTLLKYFGKPPKCFALHYNYWMVGTIKFYNIVSSFCGPFTRGLRNKYRKQFIHNYLVHTKNNYPNHIEQEPKPFKVFTDLIFFSIILLYLF